MMKKNNNMLFSSGHASDTGVDRRGLKGQAGLSYLFIKEKLGPFVCFPMASLGMNREDSRL
jgi:hypothetical protein